MRRARRLANPLSERFIKGGLTVKVFISHSTTDRWISSKIAEDIRLLGAEVFLDARDIETGDDVDETLRDQLMEAHEMLVVISPLSLKSHWVMMEMGAARTLRKRLIPILMHVSPNELPAPINRHLARDINEIERYYQELKQRLESIDSGVSAATTASTAPIITPMPPPPGEVQQFRIGDRVKISERPLDPDIWPVLNERMRQYLGLTSKVMNVADSPPGYDGAFLLDVDNETFFWAERWLMSLDSDDD
jgi:hypothetical protein